MRVLLGSMVVLSPPVPATATAQRMRFVVMGTAKSKFPNARAKPIVARVRPASRDAALASPTTVAAAVTMTAQGSRFASAACAKTPTRRNAAKTVIVPPESVALTGSAKKRAVRATAKAKPTAPWIVFATDGTGRVTRYPLEPAVMIPSVRGAATSPRGGRLVAALIALPMQSAQLPASAFRKLAGCRKVNVRTMRTAPVVARAMPGSARAVTVHVAARKIAPRVSSVTPKPVSASAVTAVVAGCPQVWVFPSAMTTQIARPISNVFNWAGKAFACLAAIQQISSAGS